MPPALFTPFTPSPSPTPTPTPTPAPVVAVVADRAHELFFEGVAAAVSADSARIATSFSGIADAAAYRAEGRYALIVYLDGSADEDLAPLLAAKARGVPVCVYAAAGQAVPDALISLRYDDSGAAAAALETALTYPPHDTPVRLIGLFASGESDAYQAFAAAADEGRILKKGVYNAGSAKQDAAEWLDSKLLDALPGTIDGIYAETAALALAAGERIVAAGLTNTEVFCAETGDALLTEMLAHPDVYAAAAGKNDAYAGAYLRAQAGRLLAGLAEAESGTMLPRLFTGAHLAEDWGRLAEE